MSKENNKTAAGLRRSAIAERLRVRQEWSELKGTNNDAADLVKVKESKNSVRNVKRQKNTVSCTKHHTLDKLKEIREVLCGFVVFVDVGSESREQALRAALAALGASVMPTWSPLVTHVVWSQGGCRNTRAKARALACHLVSPLWVEACASARRRLPERLFPAPARLSDLPSPATMRRMLKQADQEKLLLEYFPSQCQENDKGKPLPLRISSETVCNTTNTTPDISSDASHSQSADKSRSKSKNKSRDSTDIEKNVNTAPRRRIQVSGQSRKSAKSRRKLFTQKEVETNSGDDESDKEQNPAGPSKMPSSKLTQRERKDLARAEQMAKRLLGITPSNNKQKKIPEISHKSPRIVLTGMTQLERHEAIQAIRHLNGKIKNKVNKYTTHVILGSCYEPSEHPLTANEKRTPTKQTVVMCNQCNSPGNILERMFNTSVVVSTQTQKVDFQNVLCSCENISGVAKLNVSNNNVALVNNRENVYDVRSNKPRTVKALLGAARGCRVLNLNWVRDSLKADRWLNHIGYEVRHLLKICQRARVERSALQKLRSEYGYNVFSGIRIKIAPEAEQKDAVTQLLSLCGAVLCDGPICTQIQDGVQNEHGDIITTGVELTIGRGVGEVCSKWVFDSVAAARMRTMRRYVNIS